MTTPIMHVIPANHLCSQITNNSNILDIGTGHGYFAALLHKYSLIRKFEEVKVQGADIYPDLITTAKSLTPEVEFMEMDFF